MTDLIGIDFSRKTASFTHAPPTEEKMHATAVNGIIMNMKRRHLIHDKTKTATKTWTTTNNNIDNDER